MQASGVDRVGRHSQALSWLSEPPRGRDVVRGVSSSVSMLSLNASWLYAVTRARALVFVVAEYSPHAPSPVGAASSSRLQFRREPRGAGIPERA